MGGPEERRHHDDSWALGDQSSLVPKTLLWCTRSKVEKPRSQSSKQRGNHFGTIPIGIGKQQTYPSLTLFVNLLFLLLEEMFLFC